MGKGEISHGRDLNGDPDKCHDKARKRPGDGCTEDLRPLSPSDRPDKKREEEKATGKRGVECPRKRAIAAQSQGAKIDDECEQYRWDDHARPRKKLLICDELSAMQFLSSLDHMMIAGAANQNAVPFRKLF